MDDLNALAGRYGSAKRPGSKPVRDRPPHVTHADVEALGKLSEALEIVEDARGRLYEFHRLCGTADLALQDAVRMLAEAGHDELAGTVENVLVGRDVIAERWSFQLVEEYDEGYWEVCRAVEAAARRRLGASQHLHEAQMKHAEQNRGESR